jgi:hypothetical protein
VFKFVLGDPGHLLLEFFRALAFVRHGGLNVASCFCINKNDNDEILIITKSNDHL